jgi:ABC-type multidrug transport system fused ATPase/permease subunit
LILGIAQIFLSLSPYAFGKAIGALQNLAFGTKSQVIFWLLVGVVFVFWLFQGPGRAIERSVALKIQHKFRLNFYDQLINLPLKWHGIKSIILETLLLVLIVLQ